MVRKIFSGILITLCSIMLALSISGIVLVWRYNQPLTLITTALLQTIDQELALAQTAFQDAKLELERTLRLVESAETSMEALKDEFTLVKSFFDNTTGVLDDQLLPGLINTRGKIDQAKSSLQGLRDKLEEINSTLQYLDLNLPGDQLFGDLIDSADSLDGQIVAVQNLVKSASTFVSDASYLMDSDFTETKTNLKNFLAIVMEYEQKLIDWRARVDKLLVSLPGWIMITSIGLTIFLVWFGVSQVSMILHGLAPWRRGNPRTVFQKPDDDEVNVELIPPSSPN